MLPVRPATKGAYHQFCLREPGRRKSDNQKCRDDVRCAHHLSASFVAARAITASKRTGYHCATTSRWTYGELIVARDCRSNWVLWTGIKGGVARSVECIKRTDCDKCYAGLPI